MGNKVNMWLILILFVAFSDRKQSSRTQLGVSETEFLFKRVSGPMKHVLPK
jgi:hypothetical protein